MTKKQDFIRDEQSRDQHPERHQVGSPTAAFDAAEQSEMPVPQGGKVAHEHNKTGRQVPTQVNQGQRTPKSRHDRESIGAGSQNQVSARKGGAGAGRTPRGAG
jgi:hypothetical protein